MSSSALVLSVLVANFQMCANDIVPLTASRGKGFHPHLHRRAGKTVGAINLTTMVLPRSHRTTTAKGTTMMAEVHNHTKTVSGHATKAPPTRRCSPPRPPTTVTATGGTAADRGGPHMYAWVFS
jgi:hypothetical protein